MFFIVSRLSAPHCVPFKLNFLILIKRECWKFVSVAYGKALRIAFLFVKVHGVNNSQLKRLKSGSALIYFGVLCIVAVWDFAGKYRNRNTYFKMDNYCVAAVGSIELLIKRVVGHFSCI